MSQAEKISQLPPPRTSQHYSALRDKGLELITRYTAESWTDHNVHDPGITFLEAFSYALTDIGFRTQLDIVDLIKSGERRAPKDLIPAHLVLPTAAVTLNDLRKTLLDHYLVNDAWVTTNTRSEIPIYKDELADPPITYTIGPNNIRLTGLYEVLLEFNEIEKNNLNSNSYLVTVEVDGNTYSLDISLPYWDEKDSKLFYEPISILGIEMINDGTGIWRALDEELTYFAMLRIQYGPGPDEHTQIWLVLRIVDAIKAQESLINDILDEAEIAIEAIGPDTLLDQYSNRVLSAHTNVNIVKHYINRWRNLTEYPVRLSVVREQEIAILARIEINSGIDIELLLANIFLAIDSELSSPIVFSSLAELRAEGKTTQDIYDGPLLKNGFLQDPDENSNSRINPPSEIYTSDILNLIMNLRGGDSEVISELETTEQRDIISISDLTLSNFINNRLITKGAKDCLRLVEIERYRPSLSIAKSQIIFINNDNKLQYSFPRVRELFEQLRQQRDTANLIEDTSAIWPVAAGDNLPVDDYYPFQNELPLVYGVGEAGLPDDATTERKSQALQTKAYLLLSEQFLADTAEQLININRFFSANEDEEQTCFINPIFDLPGINKLIKRYGSSDDWSDFITDPENPYQSALHNAIETREQFLDRRNRMMDHLLARYGLQATSWAQELHRWTHSELANAGLLPEVFQEKVKIRRDEVNAALIKMKAAFLKDSAMLNATRLQAYGHPVFWDTSIISVYSDGTEYRWQLILGDDILLNSVNAYTTSAAAYTAAEESVILASQALYYQVINEGSNFYYQLMDGANPDNRIVGRSESSWSSETAAEDASLQSASSFLALLIKSSLTPMERSIAHLSGLMQERRSLLAEADVYFEIYDEVDADGIIEKRWRLWENPGYSGSILLSSIYHFTAPPEIVIPAEQDVAATALAEDSIQQVIQYGIHEWNYKISPAGPDTYNFELQDITGQKIGHYISPIDSIAETQQAIFDTVAKLDQLYSSEGYHMVEHILLRPQQDTDLFLSIPLDDTEKESDPYSHRISLIFPSGYAQNFPLLPEDLQREEVTPHRFRDLQFRKYIERLVHQTCPAHILPAIYWVDQQLPGSPDSLSSFNSFEARYFIWLESILVPGVDTTTIDTNRNDVIESLNEIANG